MTTRTTRRMRVWARTYRKSPTLRALLVAAVVLVTRIPFLDAGYGADPDAWRVASAARTIATTGQYVASRLPGYPIQELAYALLWPAGPLVFNALTAFFSALAAAFFALALRQLGCKDGALAGLAFAFTPVVFINSTNSMDYIWALAFLMGSLQAVLAGRPLIAGLLVGLAIGCRITSGAMLIPFVLLLWQRERTQDRLARIATFVVPACVVGAISFVPVFAVYGIGFWTFYESTYPAPSTIISLGFIRVWGQIGASMLLIALMTLVGRCQSRGNGPPGPLNGVKDILLSSKNSPLAQRVPRLEGPSIGALPWLHRLACIVAIALYGIAFARLPVESGYLIPMIPFALILLGIYLERRVFQLVCVALLLSSFVSFDQSGIATGLIFADRTGRFAGASVTRRALVLAGRLREKSLVVVGPLLPQVQATSLDNPARNVTYVYALTATQAQAYRTKGYAIHYLMGMREFNLGQNGADLDQYGATPLGPRGRGTGGEDVDAE